MAPCFERELGTTVIVENVAGGSQAVGMTEMVNSDPDGYTLGTISAGSAIVPPLVEESVTFDRDSYRTIGAISVLPSVFFVRDDSRFDSAEALFSAVEAEPGSVSLATPGATTALHFGQQALAEQYGVTFKAVPFGGHPPMMAAILGGNTEVAFDAATPDIVKQIEAGDLRALATGSEEVPPYLEGASTLAELGYTDLPDTTTYFGLGAPAGVPDDVIATLEQTLETCLADEKVVSVVGENYVPDQFIGAAELGAIYDKLTAEYTPFAQR
ncbi:tripartite tricarboxylate transporter substrate binding protein [Pseudonocardia nigra]|uniref:tripartite tricarboxylate transporter substrate binding protein n=1 Tax=Pseudonocardia nigra TaxID=1921578 RepID=UPI001C5F1EC7|nr:tripartite tricarboxylate transporter substrate binding protein [Pseudonocardia nigra]